MSEYINYNGSKIKNLTGRIFGDYKAIKPVDIKNKSAQWECECTKCGDKCIIGTHDISSGKFCPKYKSKENREKWNNREKKGNKLILKAGNKYDRWIVRKPIEGKTGNYYECICEECGTVREIPAKILKRGTKAYSCKCSKTETGIDPKNDLDMANPDTFSHKNMGHMLFPPSGLQAPRLPHTGFLRVKSTRLHLSRASHGAEMLPPPRKHPERQAPFRPSSIPAPA